MFEYENYYKVYNARAAEDYFDDAEKLRRILEGNKPPKECGKPHIDFFAMKRNFC
ncbi:MAG: hypothetical protein ACLR23_00465 [Clostridia bacterium]